jgi:hypothetical protein
MPALSDVVNNATRLVQLKELLVILADEIDQRPGARDLAQLSRQYRETLKEIEEIEGTAGDNDEIGELLAERAADGKPGAVRKDRSGLYSE